MPQQNESVFLEHVQSLTEIGIVSAAAKQEEAIAEHKKNEATAERLQQEALQDYVKENLHPTVVTLKDQIITTAVTGKDALIKEWTQRADTQELLERTALRNAVAKQFTAMSFEVTEYDLPPNSLDSLHATGVQIYWGPDIQQAD